MGLFKEASNEMAYAKIGLYGWQGAGKTFTATVIALGIQKLLKSKKPIFFVDTETGSDWMIKVCKKEKVKLHVAKTRAFSDLLKVFTEVEGTGDVLIIDSVSHIWNELMSSYLKKKKRDRLILPDWNILKPMWRQFTDLFLTSKIHIIICGRAGWEWDQVADEDGHRELVKQGTKMKAEGEFGYEPSLLVEMERVRDENNPKKMLHRASVLKDRSQLLDGEHADNPTFEFFMPHIKELNIGGEHVALDTSRTSEEIFDGNGKPEWKKRKERCEVILEEIEAEMVKAGLAGSSGDLKKNKITMLEFLFDTASWKAIQGLSLEDLQRGLETLRSASTNEAYLKSILEKQITYKDILEMEAEEAKKEEDVPMTPGENTPPSEQDGFQF